MVASNIEILDDSMMDGTIVHPPGLGSVTVVGHRLWWKGRPPETRPLLLAQWYQDATSFRPPTIPSCSPPQFTKKRASVSSLRHRPLQVMKIASMELEPAQKTTDKDTLSLSSHDGGVWQVEERLQEQIVATACCYLECTCSLLYGMYQVQGGELAFRTSVQEPTGPFGGSNHIGNTHYLFCFFLIDSTVRIRLVTAVPPQQEDLVVQKHKHKHKEQSWTYRPPSDNF